jgi:cellulose biosynthesis protein BcsQ
VACRASAAQEHPGLQGADRLGVVHARRRLARKALHQKRLTRRFDVILIDCPPLLNVSCVNALAASDAMLIPVLLARKTTERVVALLEIVRSIRDRVNANLGVLGVLANRINPRGSLTAVESNAWDALRDQCHGAWVEKVNLFETTIRQSVEIRDAEAESRCLGPDDEVHASFRALAEEIEGRLPPYSLPSKRQSSRREVAP